MCKLHHLCKVALAVRSSPAAGTWVVDRAIGFGDAIDQLQVLLRPPAMVVLQPETLLGLLQSELFDVRQAEQPRYQVFFN